MKKPTEAYCDKIEQAFSILGQRWNGLILHALLHGPKRFKELEQLIPHISGKMLTERLKLLSSHGLIIKSDQYYVLSEKGKHLDQAMEDLRQWVIEHPQ